MASNIAVELGGGWRNVRVPDFSDTLIGELSHAVISEAWDANTKLLRLGGRFQGYGSLCPVWPKVWRNTM